MPLYIYPVPKDNSLLFPDATLVKANDQDLARLNIVQVENILFPDAANDFHTAITLSEYLKEIQTKAIANDRYTPNASDIPRFGNSTNTDFPTSMILKVYVEACRQMNANSQSFTPDLQFNFQQLNDGIEVTYSNYGLYFATIKKSAQDPLFKNFLITSGLTLHRSERSFFTNPPATNTVLKATDGYLFLSRGQTTEYPNMLHQLISGHHSPQLMDLASTSDGINLDMLVRKQLGEETGLDQIYLQNLRLLGLAYSIGYEGGSEKAEFLTYAELSLPSSEVWQSMATYSQIEESQSLFVVAQDDVPALLNGSLDKSTPLELPRSIKMYGSENGKNLGTDPSASGYWVPAGALGLIASQEMLGMLPENYQGIPT